MTQRRTPRRLKARPTAPLLVPTPSTPVGVKEVSIEESFEAWRRCVKTASEMPPMRRSAMRT